MVLKEEGRVRMKERKRMLKRLHEKIRNRNRKPWEAWFILWMIGLAAEIFLFNFSAWKSRLYHDRMVVDEISVEGGTEIGKGENKMPIYAVEEGEMSLHVTGVDAKIHNLSLLFQFIESDSEPKMVPYTVSLTDEGNYYAYSLPEQVWVSDIPRTYYINVYPAGKVSEISIQLTIPAGSMVEVNGIFLNVQIPFVFSLGRLVLIWAVLCLMYFAGCVGKGSMEAKKWVGTKRQKAVATIVAVLLMGMAWQLAHVNPICITSPWPHHKQYQELAEAIAGGSFCLAAQPSGELLQVENPYDTIYLQANGIDYQADYAYFEGKYYVYFGIVPELLLYLPCYLLTGRHLPNYLAVFVFYCGFILAVFALYREMVKRWFANIPYFLYLTACVLTVCSGNYLFVIARPDLYDTPIMAANMFTAAGLWLWIKGKYAMTSRGRKMAYLLGSFCMALVAGCRPQMLLFSFLAVPLFWDEVIKERELFGRKNPLDTLCICLPYVLVAAGIMYYNAARFGSPFDFGATYSLTSNDMTKREFHLHQALLGLWHYFLQLPAVSNEFPFLQGIQIASGTYMGKLNAEYTYGGMLVCNAFAWMLLFARRGKKLLKQKGIYAFVLVNLAVSVALGVVDVTGAGILQRYMADMIWGTLLASGLILFALWEVSGAAERRKGLMMFLVIVCLLQALYGFGVVMGNGDLSVNVRSSNPELYYYLKSLVMF